MSHADSSRPLRIEQLELRSMLTANLLSLITGPLEFSGEANNLIDRTSHQASDWHVRGSADRSAQVRNVGADFTGRPGDALGGQGQRPAGKYDRTDGFGRPGTQPRVPEQNSASIGIPSQQQPVFILRVITLDPAVDQSINQQPRPSEQVQTIAATTNELSSSRTETTGPTSLAFEWVSESMDARSSIEQRNFRANESPLTTISADNNIQASANPINESKPRIPTQSSPSNPISDRDLDDGLIDPFSRASDQPMNDSPGPSQPWQIDRGTLRALRHASSLLRDNAPDATDIAVADWFNGHAGLIDFGITSIPFAIPMIPDALVDVRLNASVGMHRAIDLIAADIDRPVVDSIRDAIMAALVEAENDSSSASIESMPIRSTQTAYTSVAMVLGTVALTAQRKRLTKKYAETPGTGPGISDIE